MIEDMEHLGLIDNMMRELQDDIVKYNELASGVTDKATLIALRKQQNDEMREHLRKHMRHLKQMNGEYIEPENHFIEAVINGKGGLIY